MRIHFATGLLIQAFCATAFAQTSMTIYGSVDNGVTYVNNLRGKSSVAMQDGINKSNTLGFLDTEDLGGGQKALMRLENGFSVNTGALGQGGLLFGKQAYVGLGNNTVGQVTVGRQYDFTVLLEHYLPCLQCGLFTVENADLDRVSGERLNNSVQFRSVDFGGATLGAMYAFGSPAIGTTNRGRAFSLSAEYVNGPFSAGIAATDINGAPIFSGLLGTTSVLGVSTVTTPALFADHQRIVGGGVSYTLAAWHFAGLYTNTHLKLGSTASTDQLLHVGADYRLSPNLLLLAAVQTDKFEHSRWNSIDLGIDYNLSKRTDVYIDAVVQKASGPGTHASIALTAPSSTESQVVTRIGMKHLF